jgi:predicted RNase H-like HicB family nuclease
MKHVIQFHVYKGDKYYIAEGLDLPVVTQAKTLDELAKNIEEAVSLHLEDENLADYSLAPEPSVMLNLELGISAHA